MLNFLENHDEVRIASPQFAGEADRGRPALVVSATISTCPMMIYAGQELGEPALDAEGFSGCDGRTTIFDYWSVPTLREWLMSGRLGGRHHLRDYYKRVLTLCNSEAAIARGGMYDLMYANPHLHRQYAFVRHFGNEVLLIAANFEDRPCKAHVNIPAHAFQHIGLSEQVCQASELIHRCKDKFALTPDTPLVFDIKANDAEIWKLNL